MPVQEFINQIEFQEILQKAKSLKTNIFSDIIDEKGNQYVDLVQEGGGVLGIALVGYTYVMEEAGIRFFNLAGTSAGAINTLVMAGIGKINERKSEKILEILVNQNLFDLVDGNKKLKNIMQKGIEGTPFKKLIWRLIWNSRTLKKAIFNNLGLNPGIKFESWMDTTLKSAETEIESIGKLLELRDKKNFPTGLIHRNTGNIDDKKALVHIITADITTQSKVRFPEMAHIYWDDYKNTSPAKMVRASMSVPFFYQPFEIDNIPNHGKEADEEWIRLTNYRGIIPERAKFVDGGMISNFPINVFHKEDGGTPRKPTFGVKLSVYREESNEVDDIGSFMGSMISTMRHDGDNEFLIKHPDFSKLICYIDADKDFKWLNFNMPIERQKNLFLLGAKKAIDFLENFDWEGYKKLRKV